MTAVVAAARAGLRIPQPWLRSRMGIPEPAEGEEILVGALAGQAAAGEDEDDDEEDDG